MARDAEDLQKAIEQYVRAYQEQPETEEELAWTEAALAAVLEEDPWEDDEEGAENQPEPPQAPRR